MFVIYLHICIQPNVKVHEATCRHIIKKSFGHRKQTHTFVLMAFISKIEVAIMELKKKSPNEHLTIRGVNRQHYKPHIPIIPLLSHGILRKSEDTGNCNKQYQRVE